MKVKIVNKGLEHYRSLLLYGCFQILLFFLIEMNNDIGVLTVLSVLQLIINLFFTYKCYGLFSLPTLFVFFSYVMHLGHYVIDVFNINANIPHFFNFMSMFSTDIILDVERFVLKSQIFVMIGMVLVNSNRRRKSVPLVIKNISRQEKYMKNIAIIFLGLGVLPSTYLDVVRILYYIQGGYINTYNVVNFGFIQVFANFFKFGLIFLMMSYSSKPIKMKAVLTFSIIYLLMTMLSGHRFFAILTIITLLYVYCWIAKNGEFIINLKTILLVILLVVFLNTIANVRNSNGSMTDLFSFISDNVIWDSVAEYGVTSVSVAYAMIFIGMSKSWGYGIGYIMSLFSIIPDVTGLMNKYSNYMVFTYNIPYPYKAALGGTYIGELYYNFSEWGIVGGLFVGILIAFVSEKLEKYAKEKNYVMFAIYITLFPFILMWVRGYFRDLIRTFVWQFIIIGCTIKRVSKK